MRLDFRVSHAAAVRAAPVLVVVALLAGCGPAEDRGPVESATPVVAPSPNRAAGSSDGTNASAPPSAPADAAKPTHPALVVDTLDHGRFDLAEKRGRWVVVNFWATWCAPCLKEIPDFNALDARREDIEVIGLAYEEITPEAMRAFYAEKVKPEYAVAIVDVYSPPADFQTPRGLPFTVLVAPDGTVAHQFLGPVTGADIEAKISAVSATAPTTAPPPSTTSAPQPA